MSLAPVHRYIGRIIHLMRKEKGMRQSELALLAGLKQPNLSRIENGLVTPRPVTLQRIAQALAVDVQEFYSERKVQEVERKWAASLGPKHAAMMLADKLSAVPLFDITTGRPIEIDNAGEPQGQLEVVLQLPRDKVLGENKAFAVRAPDNSMVRHGSADDFHLGEVLIFSLNAQPATGDFALVRLAEGMLFRQMDFLDMDRVRLSALSPDFPERIVPRSEIRQMWKLIRHMRSHIHEVAANGM
jgi:transcriptional regulator with XRE-family HTH domain